MFSTMFIAAAQFFTMFTTLFSAGDKACKALDNLASWAEETSDQFNQTARIERSNELHKLRHQAALEQNSRELEAAAQLQPTSVPTSVPTPAPAKAPKA